MKPKTAPRLTAPSPARGRPRLFQDLFLKFQLRDPPAQPREHGTTALRTHAQALPLLAAWTDQAHAVLADLGYEGERAALTTPVKTTAGRRLTDDERTVNLLHAAIRAPAERGNALLKMSVKALRRMSLWPRRIGAITAAAPVLLHHQHGRTT